MKKWKECPRIKLETLSTSTLHEWRNPNVYTTLRDAIYQHLNFPLSFRWGAGARGQTQICIETIETLLNKANFNQKIKVYPIYRMYPTYVFPTVGRGGSYTCAMNDGSFY